MSTTGSDIEASSLKKQKTVETPENIVIKLTNNKNDQPFYVTVKPTVTFRRILTTYSEHYNLEEGSVCFIYQGNKILANLTPADINFPDGGEIDVMSQVSGGGSKRLVIQ